MIDVAGNKGNYQLYKESFMTLEKKGVSRATVDEDDHDPVMDLHAVMHQDTYKALSPLKRSKGTYGRATSLENSEPKSQRRSRPRRSNSAASYAKADNQDRYSIRVTSASGAKPNSRRHLYSEDHKERYTEYQAPVGTQNVEHANFLGLQVGLEGKKTRQSCSPARSRSSKRSGNSNSPKKRSSSKKDSVFRGLSTKAIGLFKDADKNEDQIFQKMNDESLVVVSSGKNSPLATQADHNFEQHHIENMESVSGSGLKPKMLKGSKTVLFQKYADPNNVNPEDIIIDTNREVNELAKSHKLGTHFSPDNSMQKEERIAKLRYDRDFFNKHIMNRTGVPTITAKKRETTALMNLNSFGNNPLSANQVNMDRGKTMNISLLKELASIEKQKHIKMKTEQFVLLFNKNADQGINYLISSNLVEDNPEKIAHALLVTEGLNKSMTGEYLGSYKEKNKKVLRAYCEILDFRNLEFDQALRLLLSRFKLPGEAQQIERIVNVFASVFHRDNPKVFGDEDTPFILAYSLLMLNTDAHSDMIASKNKMTRHQFIENNHKICKTLSKEYLGRMFDNITKHKFETKADYIETIYNRLHQGHFSIQGESLKSLFDMAKELMAGAKFIKYGRKGKSHERKVWISDREDAILWAGPNQKNEKPREMPFSEIRDVLVGHNSTQVLLKNKVPSEFDALILSIVSSNRTLDLRAPDVNTRVKWERYFRLQLLQRKDNSKGRVSKGGQQRKQAEKERLSEIWKVDILPNWESHWDYERRQPQNLDQMFVQKTSKKNFKAPRKSNQRSSSGFWGMFRKKKKTAKKYEKSLKNNDENNQIKADGFDEEDDDNEFLEICKNKNILLVTLWKRGIPDWLRSTLWPISIANQLEITENLYEILLSQAKVFLKEPTMEKSAIVDSLKRMESDLEESIQYFPEIQERKASLLNILEAFIFYRPDVGYVKGMCRLAIILLMYCPEYQAFSCFINLTHSHHFISFFRGIMREIEWRIRFFNKVFEDELPHLYDHFKALDLSSEMFLLDWFLSLFSMAISDSDIISRIWDCFLLEGEVYAIKTGVAILKYFELELKMLTFDGAIKFLKELPHDLDQDLLFTLIERVDVSWGSYKNELEAQKVAEINSKVHQALLEN